MSKLKKLIENPYILFRQPRVLDCLHWVDDRTYLKLAFRGRMGGVLDLDNPSSFNEKLQWLKINDRNPLYCTLVDKYAVKSWVAGIIGEEYVTKSYGCWEKTADIDFEALPDRFVLKTNHDCGGVVICRDRSHFDFTGAKKILDKHLHTNYYWRTREWAYRDVKPIVFAEEYLDSVVDDQASNSPEPSLQGIVDYKFYCFNGEPKFLYVSKGLEDHETARISFLETDWSFAPFVRNDYASFERLPDKPSCYQEMLSLSRILSAGIPFVRVDFFEYKGMPRFSEMTFCPCAGYMHFEPEEWDLRVGNMLDLNQVRTEVTNAKG